MSNEVDVMVGTAQLGSDNSLWTYDPAGYTPDQTGAFFKRMPDAPDRCVVITAWTVAGLPNGPLDQINVQLRFRGAPDNETDVDLLGGMAFDFFHGRTDYMLGAVHVIQCLQRSSAPLGLDDSNRWERADTYVLDVDVPPTANRPL